MISTKSCVFARASKSHMIQLKRKNKKRFSASKRGKSCALKRSKRINIHSTHYKKTVPSGKVSRPGTSFQKALWEGFLEQKSLAPYCSGHGLGSKPTRAILLCPWERHFTPLSSAWWSRKAVLNFNHISIKMQFMDRVYFFNHITITYSNTHISYLYKTK